MNDGSLPSTPNRLVTAALAPLCLRQTPNQRRPLAEMLSMTRTVTRSLTCRARRSLISPLIQEFGSGGGRRGLLARGVQILRNDLVVVVGGGLAPSGCPTTTVMDNATIAMREEKCSKSWTISTIPFERTRALSGRCVCRLTTRITDPVSPFSAAVTVARASTSPMRAMATTS